MIYPKNIRCFWTLAAMSLRIILLTKSTAIYTRCRLMTVLPWRLSEIVIFAAVASAMTVLGSLSSYANFYVTFNWPVKSKKVKWSRGRSRFSMSLQPLFPLCRCRPCRREKPGSLYLRTPGINLKNSHPAPTC